MRFALIAALVLAACDGQSSGANSSAEPPRMTPANLPTFFDCLRENEAIMVSAHRGGPSPGFAENAIPTFENTLRYAPVFLEVDVASTRDDTLVLMHDDRVDRTTNGRGAVSSLTLEEFQALRLRDDGGQVLDAAPPTLREALDWARGRAVLELDIKRGVSHEDVVREARAARAMDRVVFITYSASGARRIARIAPEAMIYTSLRNIGELDELEGAGVDLSHIVAWLGDDRPDERLLEALNARGIEGRVGQFGRYPNYVALALAGVEGVSADDAAGAVRAFDSADDAEGYEALQCVGAD